MRTLGFGADVPRFRASQTFSVNKNTAQGQRSGSIARPTRSYHGHHGNGGLAKQIAQLHRTLVQLQRALNAFVEVKLPGGGAADFRKPTTDAGQPLRRLFPSAYADGKSKPAGEDRPSPRAISNAVSTATGDKENKAGASDLFWLWGQFLDHDIDLSTGGDEPLSIAVPKGDPVFDPKGEGGKTLSTHRSKSVTNPFGTRQQVNDITALIDGSNIYGSDVDKTNSLRSFEGGRLKTGDNGSLPTSERGFFMAGDTRANENIALTSMHTIWMREHNRIADILSAEYPQWTDEQVFQESRRWVTAQLQAITANEFLPILLGGDGLGDYKGPRKLDAQISNAFSTAAFRFGHSMVSDTLERVDADGNRDPISLRNAFFNPKAFSETGVDPILRGLAGNVAQAMDTEIVDSIRDFVMDAPGAPNLDLAALNIARGRDHGLPSLNDARRALGMPPITSFDDPAFRDGAGAKLAQVYDSPEDIDLWVGLLSEAPQGEGFVGPTQRAILVDQFIRLRDGDPNWYENVFSPWQKSMLKDLTLSDVIRRNSGVGDIQDNAMIARS